MSSYQALMQILGPEACKQMIRDADAENEAENGLFAEEYYENVVAEDRPPSPRVSLYDGIPMPRDPYGCANPVSQEDGS